MTSLEKTILGHLLMHPELRKNLDINKNFFKSQRQRLVFKEIENGNKDAAIIVNELQKKSIEDAGSYVASLVAGIPHSKPENLNQLILKVNQQRKKNELFQLIEEEARTAIKTGDFNLTEIRKGFEELDSLDDDHKSPRFETLKEFLDRDLPKRKILIDPIFGLQEMIMIHGRPKIGKSLFTLQLSRCLIAGVDCLGFKTYKLDRPILIIQVEIAPALMQERVEKIFKDVPNTEKIIIPAQNRNIFFDKKPSRDHISKLIKEVKPALVVLDPYSKFFTDEETAFKNPRPFFDFWAEQIETHSLSLLFVHHDAKFQEGKLGGQKALGTTSINASTDGNWNIERILNVNLDAVEFNRTARLSFESRNWQNMRPIDIRLDDNLTFETTTLPKGSVNEWDIIEEIEKAGGQIEQSKLRSQYSNIRAFYQARDKALENDLIDLVKLENVRGKPVMLMLKNRDTQRDNET